MKYEYKKVTGHDQKKFIENGHTMFESEVLQRLKRLAYLEEQHKQTKGTPLESNNNIPHVSNNVLIDYIENDAEIAIPIDEFFNDDGTNITKKQYGKVLLKYLVKELREHYC